MQRTLCGVLAKKRVVVIGNSNNTFLPGRRVRRASSAISVLVINLLYCSATFDVSIKPIKMLETRLCRTISLTS